MQPIEVDMKPLDGFTPIEVTFSEHGGAVISGGDQPSAAEEPAAPPHPQPVAPSPAAAVAADTSDDAGDKRRAGKD